MSFIHLLHPWMSSMDGKVIHGWHPQMTSPSMDIISPSMDDIHGWHFHLWKDFNCQVFGRNWLHHILNEFVSNLRHDASNFLPKPDSWKFHPWMEKSHHGWKCHPWMSSIDGEISSMDELSSILRYHPWMKFRDEDDR